MTLLGLVSMVLWVVDHTDLTTPFSISDLARTLAAHPMPGSLQVWLFFAIATGFMIKVPLFPFHDVSFRWPTSKPPGGLGPAGRRPAETRQLRLPAALPSDCSRTRLRPLLRAAADRPPVGDRDRLRDRSVLSSSGDIKKLVAYSSVAHTGFCMLGLFALKQKGSPAASCR